MNIISPNCSRYIGIVSERVDGFRLEFQGALVKVARLPERQSVLDVDPYLIRKAWRREVNHGLRTGKIPAVAAVRSNSGLLLGVNLSANLHKIVQGWVFERAAGYVVGSRRGVIGRFSNKSRKRLIDHMARLDQNVKGLFITLTYRENMQDYKVAKKHLNLTLRWLKFHYPCYAVVWRMEEQGRGAIHFHLIVLGARFIPAAFLTAYWQKLTGDDSYPDVKKIRNRHQAIYYAAKYVSKVADCPQGHGFINLPYLENLGFRVDPSNDEFFLSGADPQPTAAYGQYESASGWVGRFWGIHNREFLPLADKIEVVVVDRLSAFMDFRRSAARRSKYVRRAGVSGFTLYGRAQQWARLWDYYYAKLRVRAASPPGFRLVKKSTIFKNVGSGYRDMLAAAALLA